MEIMNWGTKITVLYLGFVALILTLVFTSMGHKTELEYTDYYAREIKFQEQINATKNADALSQPIEYAVNGKTVKLKVPQELLAEAKGKIEFLRPSDQRLDKEVALNLDSDGEQFIADPSFSTGIYKMMISINSGGKTYYKEAVIKLK